MNLVDYSRKYARPLCTATHHFGSERVHAVFDPFSLILRMTEDLAHRVPSSGIYSANAITGSQTIAYSHLFHERIHWWQVAGTTSGFMAALTRAVQAEDAA